MALGRGRGVRRFDKPTRKTTSHLKDQRRTAVRGRKEQGLGSGGRSGGTKSSGGHAGGSQGPRRRAVSARRAARTSKR